MIASEQTCGVVYNFNPKDMTATRGTNPYKWPVRGFVYGSSAIKILPLSNNSSGSISISGSGFGTTTGKVVVTIPYTEQNQALFNQINPNQSTAFYTYNATVSTWNDTSITANIFNDQMKWESFNSPVTIAIYKSDNVTKVAELSYPFRDVPAAYWAAKAIHGLYKLGVVNGKGDGRYDTTSNVTRSEFLTMLLRAKLGHALTTQPASKPFDDVDITGPLSWFAPYADYAKSKQYVNGNVCVDNSNATCFRPNASISRFEASVMATNVFELTFYDTQLRPLWLDYNTAMHGYAPWIAFSHNIMNGYNTLYFGANDALTRDQAAVIVNAAMTTFKP